MQYEQFLFTRNLQRDFTAFVRPAATTNKEISTIASAFNYVNDITPLKREQPALYCFPLGAYLYVLRHYNSGRTHAGREIAVIEGIAIRRDDEALFRPLLADTLRRHNDWLNVIDTVPDVEALDMTISQTRNWTDDDPTVEAEPNGAPNALVADYANHYARERLLLPFDADGLGLLFEALDDETLPILHIALGTNNEVVGRLAEAGVEFDVVATFATQQVEYKPRPSPKGVDVREILPKAATVPSNWPVSDLAPEAADPSADPDFLVEVAPEHAEQALHTERERRQEFYHPRRRSLARVLLDFLLGR